MSMFEELKEIELDKIDGGRWNYKCIAEVWTLAYGFGYAIGETIGNLFG